MLSGGIGLVISHSTGDQAVTNKFPRISLVGNPVNRGNGAALLAERMPRLLV
jgi:hypothetical protein